MHVCLFDIDGTLLDSAGAGQAAMESTFRTQFDRSGPVSGISTAGRTDRAIVSDLFAFYGIQDTAEHWRAISETYPAHLQHQLPLQPGRLLPGILELIQHLSNRADIVLGLLTGNFRCGAQMKLRHYGLESFFEWEWGGFGDDALDRDDVARSVAAELEQQFPESIDYDRVWVIGDTPADIRCGRAIGARVVAVATGSFDAETLAAAQPDHLCTSFQDPGPLLNWLI
ncbi:MAG: haloacid dehalogenase-like hydrolase [Planctomycetaceae bacterium]